MVTLGQVMGANMQPQKLLTVQTILNFMRANSRESLLRGIDQTTEIPFSHAVIIWSFAHIIQRNVMSQEAMMSIVQMFPLELLKIGQAFEDANVLEDDAKIKELPVRVIAVSDRRFVTISGLSGCFDLKGCRVLSESPLAFEGVSYNLAVPVLVECKRIRKEADNGAKQENAGRTFKSNDALHRAFGAGGGPARP